MDVLLDWKARDGYKLNIQPDRFKHLSRDWSGWWSICKEVLGFVKMMMMTIMMKYYTVLLSIVFLPKIFCGWNTVSRMKCWPVKWCNVIEVQWLKSDLVQEDANYWYRGSLHPLFPGLTLDQSVTETRFGAVWYNQHSIPAQKGAHNKQAFSI